jgi:hypothetical protein
MLKKVYINKIPYEIDCDMGTQDVCWLAMSACYYHGMNSYPVARYIPCVARNKEGEVLHPKMVICKYNIKIGDEIYVRIKPKGNDPLEPEISKEEEQWMRQAFSNERFTMDVKVRLQPSNEMKAKDISNLSINFNFKIHPPYGIFFPNQKENFNVLLEEIGVKGKMELFQANMNMPVGNLEVNKVFYKDVNDVDKEAVGGKVTIDRYPDPLLQDQREKLIREKESMIKKKEYSLKQNIRNIEEQKKAEAIRLKELQVFLKSLPFSIDDIFEYSNKEIQDATKDLVSIFSILEKDEYSLFKKLYEIFNDYCKFYADDATTIDIESLMSFYKHYFDHSKETLLSIITDLQKYYFDRLPSSSEYNFLDFIHLLVYLLYKIHVYKMVSIDPEFEYIYMHHDTKMNDENLRAVYKDDFVIGIIKSNIDFLKRLFMKYSKHKFDNYYELTPSSFISFAKELSIKKGYDYVVLTDGMKFYDDCCFFDFLEKIVIMASRSSNEYELDLPLKLSMFIDVLNNTFDIGSEKPNSSESNKQNGALKKK